MKAVIPIFDAPSYLISRQVVLSVVVNRAAEYSIRLACCALGLQQGKEALHRRIVPNVAGTAHRADDAVIGHQLLELFSGI